MNSKAQVTIFVVVAIIIVGLILGYFVFRGFSKPSVDYSPETNPEKFLEGCLEETIRETVFKISEQGGYIENPLHRTFRFEGEENQVNISYLCFNQINYVPCVNQEPLLIQNLKTEIHENVSDVVSMCFAQLGESLEKVGYVVDARYNGFEVDLAPKKIIIEINGEMVLTKNEETRKMLNFTSTIASRFYDLAVVAQEIIAQEARFCHFENLGFMILYNVFDINKFRTGDSTTIYRIVHRDSEEKFQFAIKGCIIPPGV